MKNYQKTNKNVIRSFYVGFFLLIFLTSCSLRDEKSLIPTKEKAFRSDVSRSFEPLKVNSIAVLPFKGGSGVLLTPEELSFLTEDLVKNLELGTNLNILNFQNPTGIQSAAKSVDHLTVSQTEKAVRFCRKLSAQAVMHGLITRHDKLRGSTNNSRKDAAAGFKIWLLDCSNGQTLWSATYKKNQRPVTDNIFQASNSLKNGLVFKSLNQLFTQGFKQTADNLQQLRSTWIEQ